MLKISSVWKKHTMGNIYELGTFAWNTSIFKSKIRNHNCSAYVKVFDIVSDDTKDQKECNVYSCLEEKQHLTNNDVEE